MMTDLSELEKTLRIVRFFLPRLLREHLASEIRNEKRRLIEESNDRVKRLEIEVDAAIQNTSREKEDYAERAARRISEIHRDEEERIRQETGQLRSGLAELEQKKGPGMAKIVGIFLALVVALASLPKLGFAVPSLIAITAVCTGALAWVGRDYYRLVMRAAACRDELRLRETTIRKEVEGKIAVEEGAKATELAEYDARLRNLREKVEKDIAAEEANLRDRLAALDARLDELVRLYEDSIASEDEVVEFSNNRLAELQELVAPALGLHPNDILDERSAEVWAPSFLQIQGFPEPVLRDVAQSEQEILDWADEIIKPMRAALPKDDQWQAFRNRVLPMLGLHQQVSDSKGRDSRPDDEPVSLNSLGAVRFSSNRQAYLAGHYFFQKTVCAEDMIGLFQAYVNVLNRRVPYTFALQILYSDIAAIGIETALNRERYDLSRMTIDQNTHTLTLELSSGTSYRMSGDAGSAAQIESSGDVEAKRVISQANQAFRDQIINVRALIRDAKALANGRDA